MIRSFTTLLLAFSCALVAQNRMTPELLWKLNKVSGLGISKDGKHVIYSVSTPNVEENKSSSKKYSIPVIGGTPVLVSNVDSLLKNEKISPDGKYLLVSKEVKLKNVTGADYYPDLSKSNVYVYDNLNYRHWDTYEDGKFDHVFIEGYGNNNGKPLPIDLMQDEPYDCPQKPFGGDEDFVWNPNGKEVVYCTKKKYGKDYTVSTNTDLYSYSIETKQTKNLTSTMLGYDINPSFNSNGDLAWLTMKRDGYEADKQDIMVTIGQSMLNLTAQRDDIYVESYKWSNDGNFIFFNAPINGTLQLFSVVYPGKSKVKPVMKQITKGDFDINGIIGQSGNTLIVSRTDMNHAAELYTVDLSTGSMKQLTHANDETYASLSMSRVERRFVTTTDNKKMLVWVIYPPNFDASKKYPTLLYCQGGPQSSLTQFYSFRWNFQLMAANGYIIVAPCRRGMPGFGTEWNEQVSKDHGGQAMADYLTAIDTLAKEKFVDKDRLGCVGASYGGYSVFMLAGMHNNRFKTFISHCGIYDLKSMYGTTDEVFFSNWEYGGPYWDTQNLAAQKTFNKFSPSSYVDKWNTPILIIQGAKDYRVPIEQGQQAFMAAQLRGIKSKFMLLPDQNHWVSTAQDALVWQREFYKWLDETLK
ncbi:MAG: S9 family peptidase [Bacteroidetes bacterium]|nr:S9 family peptidase [Bacteroidota bacterium]